MASTVLLVGRTNVVINDALIRLDRPDLRILGGTSVDDVRAAFAETTIDHVVMGAGIDLDRRLEIIREIDRLSDHTTIHLKDRASGPGSFLPFVSAVLTGIIPKA